MVAPRSRFGLPVDTTALKEVEARPKKVIETLSEQCVRLRYTLGRQVMESANRGMDVIFATRRADNVEVVIKTRLRSNSFKSEQKERAWRLTTEKQLNMPRIAGLCELYEVIETPIAYYIVMEKCHGKDLDEQCQHKLTQDDAREAVRQILVALETLHGNGRVHKDLKLKNVVVDTNPQELPSECFSPLGAKIIDFDTMVDWKPDSPKSKDVLGTDGYIAPESYGGNYSPASDIYATGVMMYKLLTKRCPHRRELFDDKPGENYVGSAAMIRIQKKLKTAKTNFDVPPFNTEAEARDLVMSMLAYNPQDRPSASEALASPWFQNISRNSDSAPRLPLGRSTLKPHSDAPNEELQPPRVSTDGKSPKSCKTTNVAGKAVAGMRHFSREFSALVLGV